MDGRCVVEAANFCLPQVVVVIRTYIYTAHGGRDSARADTSVVQHRSIKRMESRSFPLLPRGQVKLFSNVKKGLPGSVSFAERILLVLF